MRIWSTVTSRYCGFARVPYVCHKRGAARDPGTISGNANEYPDLTITSGPDFVVRIMADHRAVFDEEHFVIKAACGGGSEALQKT